MADYGFYTREAAITKATEIKTALAVSKVRYFKAPFVPSAFTTKAQLVEQECDFDGYVAAGYAVAAWNGPQNDPAGGAVISTPALNPTYGPAGDPPVTNDVGGYWVEDTSGDVRYVFVYNPSRPMAVVGDGWTTVAALIEGRNAVIPIE